MAIAAAVVAVLVGGLALDGRDDDPTGAAEEERDNQDRVGLDKSSSTTERRTTTTRPATTTTLPLGPPLGVPVEGALLLIGPVWWRVVDLTDGSIRDISLPAVDSFSSLAVAGGIVVPEGGEASYYRILGGGADPEPQLLGPADFVLGAGTDRVWLVDLPSDGAGDGSAGVDVRLVDLTGRVLRSFNVPARWVEEATADAIIVSRGGRVYAADEDGMRAIAVGWSAGTNGGAAVVMTCDTDGSCALRRQPLDGGGAQTLLEVSDPDGGVNTSSEAADGRLAMVVADSYGAGAEVLFFGPDGTRLGSAAVERGRDRTRRHVGCPATSGWSSGVVAARSGSAPTAMAGRCLRSGSAIGSSEEAMLVITP